MNQKRIEAMIEAITSIKNHNKATGDIHGSMTCPMCKEGSVSWAVSSYNGHTSGACDKDGCLNWME